MILALELRTLEILVCLKSISEFTQPYNEYDMGHLCV